MIKTKDKEKKINKIEYYKEKDGLYEVELVEKSRRKVTDEEMFVDEVTEVVKSIRENNRFRTESIINPNPDRLFAMYFVKWLKERPNDYEERLSKLFEFITKL